MSSEGQCPSPVTAFWEFADVEPSAQNPLERELQVHVDALWEYARLLADAELAGRDDMAEDLAHLYHNELENAQRIRQALKGSRR